MDIFSTVTTNLCNLQNNYSKSPTLPFINIHTTFSLTNSSVSDVEDSILLVCFDLDGELLRGTEGGLVREREEANLVQSIRSVGDQFSKEDLTGGGRGGGAGGGGGGVGGGGREREGRKDGKGRERERERLCKLASVMKL